jgi:hypothetical protein
VVSVDVFERRRRDVDPLRNIGCFLPQACVRSCAVVFRRTGVFHLDFVHMWIVLLLSMIQDVG